MPQSASKASAKICSTELHDLLDEQPGACASVILELDLPPPRVSMAPNALEPARQRFAGAFVSGPSEAEVTRKARKAARRLHTILGYQPDFLRSSRTFVVTATGDQLRCIADLDEIRSIEPNRCRRL